MVKNKGEPCENSGEDRENGEKFTRVNKEIFIEKIVAFVEANIKDDRVEKKSSSLILNSFHLIN